MKWKGFYILMSKINKKAVIAFVMGIVLICTATGCSQKKKAEMTF